jgi:hypothetical protein
MCERIEERNARERGQYVAVKILADHLKQFAAEVKRVLRQKESEFPALAVGRTEPEIKVSFQVQVTDDILKKWAAHFETWTI